jgi:CHASE2 domain-containing sensor protein
MYAQAEKSIPLWSTAAAIALTVYTVLKGRRDGAAGRELAIELVIVFVLAAVTFVLARRVRPTGRTAALVVAAITVVLSVVVAIAS